MIGASLIAFVMSSSCSFRITRTAEDLAQTINSLSQRLIKLERKQEALELQMLQQLKGPTDEESQILDGVEQLLNECQELLENSDVHSDSDENWLADDDQESLAA